MKTIRTVTLGAAIALGFGITSIAAAPSAFAAPTKPGAKADPKKPAAPAEAPTTSKPVSISPKELAWGIDRKKLGEIYDRVIDEDYKPRYQKTQPGPALNDLDAEVTEKKAEFRRSLIEFKNVATGMDQTPLRSEYTYNNGEALMSIERNGKTRYFFFINNKLWKIVEAIKLGEKAKWGATFDAANTKVGEAYGAEGRVREANPAEGRPFKESDWKDATTQVRLIDWGGDEIGMGFQDAATVAQLSSLRKNKDLSAVNEVDGKVKELGRAKEDPGPPPKADPKGKAKPKSK